LHAFFDLAQKWQPNSKHILKSIDTLLPPWFKATCPIGCCNVLFQAYFQIDHALYAFGETRTSAKPVFLLFSTYIHSTLVHTTVPQAPQTTHMEIANQKVRKQQKSSKISTTFSM